MASLTAPLARIVAAAQAEGGLWEAALLAPSERASATPWAELCGPRFAAGMESIYEGYLLHGGSGRLFDASDRDRALLTGDWLYAQGLAWVAEEQDTEAVAALAELIALAARARAAGAPAASHEPLWAATAAFLKDRSLREPLALAREQAL